MARTVSFKPPTKPSTGHSSKSAAQRCRLPWDPSPLLCEAARVRLCYAIFRLFPHRVETHFGHGSFWEANAIPLPVGSAESSHLITAAAAASPEHKLSPGRAVSRLPLGLVADSAFPRWRGDATNRIVSVS